MTDSLQSVLRTAVAILDELEFPYALVGGMAASIYGEVRFTRDVDIALAINSDSEAEKCVFAMTGYGYQVLATVEHETQDRMATARLKHSSDVVVDLIFASSGIEKEIIASAVSIQLWEQQSVSVATKAALLAMKTLSFSDERPQDLQDLKAMLAHASDEEIKEAKMLLTKIESRGFNRGLDLQTRWQELERRFYRS